MLHRMRPIAGLALILTLFIAACSGGSSTGGSTSGNSTTAAKATATTPPTTKPKPSAIPTTTVASCESWLSISEANQILSPPKAIATVFVTNDTTISTCQYQVAGPDIPLLVTFENFTPGTQMSAVAQQISTKDFPGATISVNQAVTGVGDQAWFLAGTESGSGISARADVLYVADGSVLIIIENLNINGASPIGATDDGTIQTEFAQIGNLFVSRL